MSSKCPKCRFSNPWGAEICGECGEPLISDREKDKKEEKPTREKYPRLTRSIQESVPVVFRIVGYVVGINALFLIGLGCAPYFTPFWGNYIYSFTAVFLLLGGLAFIVSCGFIKARPWILSVYSMWVAIKIFLYALLWAGLWQPVPSSWLTSNTMGVLLGTLLIEIAFIPYVFIISARLEREEEKMKYLE
ncbi:MAG: hypothetical protein ACMUJM_08590 [bacterium]